MTHLRSLETRVLFIAVLCLASAACGGGDLVDIPADARGRASTRISYYPPARNSAWTISSEEMAEIARPFATAHDALPIGVPLSYDWSRFSRLHSGNDIPVGFRAFTGWGQAFWASGSALSAQALDLRGTQTFLCTIGAQAYEWSRVQQGDIDGAAFRADFAGNENVPATVVPVEPGRSRVSFPMGRAFHYWPRQGRIVLGTKPLCGVLVVFQARVVAADGSALPADAQPALLVGAGADYWVTATAPWNNYLTNIGVGVGQLRRLSTQWRWYGLSTADAASLEQLMQVGYTDLTRH